MFLQRNLEKNEETVEVGMRDKTGVVSVPTGVVPVEIEVVPGMTERDGLGETKTARIQNKTKNRSLDGRTTNEYTVTLQDARKVSLDTKKDNGSRPHAIESFLTAPME